MKAILMQVILLASESISIGYLKDKKILIPISNPIRVFKFINVFICLVEI